MKIIVTHANGTRKRVKNCSLNSWEQLKGNYKVSLREGNFANVMLVNKHGVVRDVYEA